MSHIQDDLFAEDVAERNRPPDEEMAAVRERLQTTLVRLASAQEYPWSDALDAAHEENRFQRGAELLGDEGAALWAKFDREMDRLYASQG